MLVVLSGIYWAMTNTQKIRDWYILQTYHPPAAIVSLVNIDQMTNYAKNLFYVNRPNLASKSVFAAQCPKGAYQTYVIGCYHSGDNGIYLLDVKNPSLDGIIPVTAAYEMLHAGYARLTSAARSSIDNQMWNFYLHNVNNSEIKQQMAAYAVSEPGARYDELYSVLATEVDNLPTTLNNDYRLYFKDRASIVVMYNKYQASFISRQSAIASDASELNSLKTQIDNNEAVISSELNSIKTQSATLDGQKSSGDIAAYNLGVPGYNLLVNNYDVLVNTTRSEITNYNQIVNQLNSLVLEEQQLIKSINTAPNSLAPK